MPFINLIMLDMITVIITVLLEGESGAQDIFSYIRNLRPTLGCRRPGIIFSGISLVPVLNS